MASDHPSTIYISPGPRGERWRALPGFEDRYAASSEGRVWRTGRTTAAPGPCRRARLPNGYLRVSIRRRMRYVHHLMLEAFIGPRPKGMQAWLLDADPSNLTLSNLRWASRSEIMAARDTTGLLRGEAHPRAKLTEAQVREIRALISDGRTDRAVAKRFPVKAWTIYQIRHGSTWRHVK